MSKRKVFSIEEKANLILRMENGESIANLVKEFSVPQSTLSTMKKNKDKILKLFEQDKLSLKRMRISEHPYIEEALLTWFKNQSSVNCMPVSGPILRAQAQKFAIDFNKTNFVCSAAWIQRFRNRHNIMLGKILSKSSEIPPCVSELWLNTVWPKLRECYNDDDIFNTDETGLFYRLAPDKTLKFCGKKCESGEHSEERITVLVTANMAGTEKLKLFVIGKSEKPRCFKGVKALPVIYNANKRAWMISQLFETFIENWNKGLNKSGRKILLLIDNCLAHPIVSLSNIKLVSLPANTTSIVQPMDQGIIRALKSKFRKILVLKMIRNMEAGNNLKISIFQAITMIAKSWQDVSQETISNCFCQAGFIPSRSFKILSVDSGSEETFLKWAKTLNSSLWPPEVLEHYDSIDDNLTITADVSDAEIVYGIKEKSKTTENKEHFEKDDDHPEEFKVPSLHETLEACDVIRSYCDYNDISVSESFNTLSKKF